MKDPKNNCWLWSVCKAIAVRRKDVPLYKVVEGGEEVTTWLGCENCDLPNIVRHEAGDAE